MATIKADQGRPAGATPPRQKVPPRSPDVRDVATLQRLAGNRAVRAALTGRLEVQRLATAPALRTQFGKAGFFSNNYKAILKAVDRYHAEMNKPIVWGFGQPTPDTIRHGATYLEELLDDIIAPCDRFAKSGKHTGDRRLGELARLADDARKERAVVKSRLGPLADRIRAKKWTAPPNILWRQVVDTESASYFGTRDLSAEGATQAGQQAGALNQVAELDLPAGGRGFFKKAKDSVSDDENNAENFLSLDMGIPRGLDPTSEHDRRGPRFERRGVATSRLDQLLGTNVIAKTELATVDLGGNVEKGQFLKKATGHAMGAHVLSPDQASVGANLQKHGNANTKGVVNLADPTFQRLLSKLEILDALCGQVDRHGGNFFVESDAQGSVTSLTGIDSDMSFPVPGAEGARADKLGPSKKMQEWRGVGRYFDVETAEAVLKLDGADLRAVLGDLLEADEIDATINRLHELQALLQTAKSEGRLLQPGAWNAGTVGDKNDAGYSGTWKHKQDWHFN